ncbi:hypothetical protein MUG87_18890 [Ectobacillus sp. JY-23]|uniref:hypothetical protein n=1 Tax=Ectobacillus sp. JY-23 TaxID=2933872 RepID=UPI001FF2E26F|nr:hypothetical protein [Ectobacillus sp. JY-23]UOY92454.1 hypothetical protein MUG87_18890 [Ectobacillus sp. JY-23]
MKKKWMLALFLLLSACKVVSEEPNTLQDAMKQGFRAEQITEADVIETQQVDDNLLVFYKSEDSIGIGSIYTKGKHLKWYKGQQNIGIRNDSDASASMQSTVQTEDGQDIEILVERAPKNGAYSVRVLP